MKLHVWTFLVICLFVFLVTSGMESFAQCVSKYSAFSCAVDRTR